MLTRRTFATYAGLTTLGLGLRSVPLAAQTATRASGELTRALAQAEAASGGRLGVALLDKNSGMTTGYRADERFPLCSTFKVLAAGAVLTRVDAGQTQLGTRVRFALSDVVANSPITKERAGAEGMTLAELCAAAIEYSDNTAGNMLLGQIGGPARLTQFARSLDDQVTRLDRTETDLNESLPGDLRDTTSPNAMLADLDSLVLGSALLNGSREQLTAWLRANTTGGTRLRAGLPAGWSVGDKTGAGERGSTNDIAVIWPPGRKPALLTAYLTNTAAPVEQRNATLAAVARAAAAFLQA